MTRFYRPAEFAKLASVTVRTLHYYDRIGLLTPTATTDKGHRLYTDADLIRLQQIVTLKWMGFSLDQIAEVFQNPAYDLPQALRAQKAAIDAQIERLRRASGALQTALESIKAEELAELDAASMQMIIRAVTHQNDLVEAYYSETARAGISLRALALDAEGMASAQQAWTDLYAGFESLVDQPLNHPEVLRLAARMDALVEAFTGGDDATESGLRQLVSDAEAGRLPQAPDVQAHFQQVDNDLRTFMQQALEYYRQKHKP